MYIGLPQWSHPKWARLGIQGLEDYARYFNCVEGNTTLYALPKAEIVARWREQTHDDFRFCFKFPATISHQAALRNCDDLTQEFFTRLSPLADRMGQFWLQLPATFGPQALPALWEFLDGLPKAFTYGVEVRHGEFFAKGEAETQLNRGLHARGVNRVILDSRPVHSAIPSNQAIIDAQRKKPKLPVHAVVTGYKSCRCGSKAARPGCFYTRRILPRPRNWWTPSGLLCARLCPPSAPPPQFHNNPLFSEAVALS